MNTDKEYCGCSIDTSPFGHTVEAAFYTEPGSNQLLFTTVAHRNDSPATSANQQYIDGTSQSENFVFSSVFPNTNMSIETGRGGNQCTMFEGVQLYRYDPVGSGYHNNLQDIYDDYRANFSEDTANLYKTFFTERVGFPHFHFSSRTMAEKYGKTASANAISLDMLIKYIECLMSDNNPSHTINKLDFGMPYLDIKRNPNKYKTSIDTHCLQDALMLGNVNAQLGKIFKQTSKLEPGVKILNGLEAVYTDLVLLRILRGDRTSSGSVDLHNLNLNNLNFYQYGRGRNSFLVNGFGRTPLSGEFYPENPESRNERQEKSEVSIAELQLASKVASGGSMNLKNLKCRDKMHLDKADSYVDEGSWRLLHNILHMCENQRFIRRPNDTIL